MGDESEGTVRRVFDAFRSPDSYALAIVMIVVTYVLAVSLTTPWGVSIVVVVQIVTVRLVLHTSRARHGLRLVANIALGLATIAAVANLVDPTDERLVPYAFLAGCLLYVVAPFSIIRHVVFRRRVDRETLLGVLAAYLLLGMAFAFCYRFLGGVQRGPFFGDAGGDGTVADDLFFSFVTLTTTGYGNLVPAGNPGQSLAVLEALLGQLFLVTAVAKVVNAWQPMRRDATATGSND